MVEVVREYGLGLFFVAVDKGLGDFLLENLEVLLVDGVLEEAQVLLAEIFGEARFLEFCDQGFSDIDRVDAVVFAVGEGVIKGFQDESCLYPGQSLVLGLLFQFFDIDLL